MTPYEEWEQQLANYVKELEQAEEWSKRNSDAIDPKDFEEIGLKIEKWKAKNPAPNPIPHTPKPKPPVKQGKFFADVMRANHSPGSMIRMGKRTRGVISLGAIVAAGTAGAVAIGSAAIAYLAEEAAMAAVGYAFDTVSTALREANTPSTKAECRRQYNNFVSQQSMSFNYAKTGILPPIPNEKNWFEATYGIRYDILR